MPPLDVSPAVSVRGLRSALGISRERMGRLLDVSARTIERWEDRDRLPSNRLLGMRSAQIQEIVDLGLIVYTPEGFVQFMSTPFPVFDGQTALQLVERGETERVMGALAADYEGSVT